MVSAVPTNLSIFCPVDYRTYDNVKTATLSHLRLSAPGIEM